MIRDIVLFMQHGLSMIGDNKYLQAAIAIVIGLVLARMIHLILKLAKRLARRTDTRIDDMLLQTLDRPLKVTAVLVGLGAATLLLEMPESAEFTTVAALQTILLIVWIRFIMSIVRYVCRLIANRPGKAQLIQPATLPLFDNLTLLGSIALGAYLILHVWEIDITAWLASAGIIGLALSFAAKDSLANLFAGVFIIADAPYRVGDYVVLDTGERGRITHIGVRSTRLLTRDDVEVTIPNSVMGNTKFVNETGGPHAKYRVRIPVGVCYGEDLDKVREALMEVTEANPKVCRDPAARVRYRRFGDWSVDLELLCWVDAPVLRGLVTDELIVAVYKKFNEAGITFPYPRHEHYVRSLVAPGTVDD
jgi:small-conductance mechanosensitive channel